jgi:hypothetical protein
LDIGSIRYGAQIASAAAAHHIDPQLLAAVAAQETGGPGATSGNNVVGDSGHGHGVFQIDDRSWSFAKTTAAMDPQQNANFAAGILADNLQRYGGNVKMALSAYNAGSPTATGTTTTWGDGQTLGYADSVLKHYDELGGATTEQLTADSGENSADVNSLMNAFASLSNGSTTGASTSSTSSSALWPRRSRKRRSSRQPTAARSRRRIRGRNSIARPNSPAKTPTTRWCRSWIKATSFQATATTSHDRASTR